MEAYNNTSDDIVIVVKASRDNNMMNEDPEPFSPSEIFVSNEVRQISEIVLDLCLSFVIANVGIVSNIVVIVVFARQGYAESMNVSMTAIALWDLLKCISGSVQRMSGPISLVSGAYAESWVNIMTVAMNYFISFASYVSSVLAAYVAVERCLCVTLPFTVKTLLTPKVTLVAMVTLSVLVFGLFAVIFGIYDLVWTYSPRWNTTIAVYRYNEFFKANQGPLMQYYNLSGVIWPTLSFVVIVVCTVIIFYQLQKASKFRKRTTTTTTTTTTTNNTSNMQQQQKTGSTAASSSSSSSSSSMSDRDRQVIKMLLVIIVIYIVNLFPRIALYMVKYFIHEFYFLRKYHNLFVVICHWIFLFDLTNATVNLFVFLSMSTNFRDTTKALFGVVEKKHCKQKS